MRAMELNRIGMYCVKSIGFNSQAIQCCLLYIYRRREAVSFLGFCIEQNEEDWGVHRIGETQSAPIFFSPRNPGKRGDAVSLVDAVIPNIVVW